jgi:hypothetical protein
MDFPWIGFIFWFGLFSWAGARVWSRYQIELERQKTLRIFAERGTALDKQMIERLNPVRMTWQVSPEAISRGLAVAGIVTLFIGVGMVVGALPVSRLEPDALYGMLTGAAIVASLGLGLLTSSWLLRRLRSGHQQRPEVDATIR